MTPRTSQRAHAQEIFREMVEQLPPASLQTPLIPAQAGIQGDSAMSVDGCPGSPLARGRAEGDLSARLRALYETSAVPVREIAQIAGVSERTLYKYARKGGWRPRYAWAGGGGVARARWRAKTTREQFAPAKGAGGRFIARADQGKPFARGLKATDVAGAARAALACARAERIAAAAQADAVWLAWHETFLVCLRSVRTIGEQLKTCRQARAQRGAGGFAADARAQTLERAGQVALDYLEFCQARIAVLPVPGARPFDVNSRQRLVIGKS
jgi:hypothetical protein